MAAIAGLAGAMLTAAPVVAQDGASGSLPERIDLTVTAPQLRTTEEECARQREAAVVSGEIVVCGARPGQTDPRYSSREDAQNRYAEQTAFRDDPATPDVAGPGIFRGPATVSGVCVPGLFNCPKPPALMVDVTALPQAPPGSDADRIARGLKPLGESNETVVARQVTARQREELGLPAPSDAPATAPVSPAESASPAAPQ